MRKFGLSVCAALLALVASQSALAWHIEGYVRCDGNKNGQLDGQDIGLSGVDVHIVNTGGTFSVTGTTDANGHYFIALGDQADCYTATLDPATLPADANVIIPGSPYNFCTDNSNFALRVDFLVQSDSCQPGQCWMTGGGTTYEPLTGTYLANKNSKITFGGNVHPGCSATAGAGGDWNHVDRVRKLHFHGTDIPTVSCGNVPDIPPGSTSPKTPFNYIDYSGTGWVHGFQGNKANYPLVYFIARVEDRNEPGSNGAKDGSLIDRYFLRVYTDPADPIGSTIILLDSDNGGGLERDTTLINSGNLQIHVSSCDNPPLQ